jgi:hypothetical protein
MSDKPDNQPAETEKGFGTGLRAQLQRRREDETQQGEAGPTNVELRFELTARPAGDSLEAVVGGPDVQALKAELEAAQAREARGLRGRAGGARAARARAERGPRGRARPRC